MCGESPPYGRSVKRFSRRAIDEGRRYVPCATVLGGTSRNSGGTKKATRIVNGNVLHHSLSETLREGKDNRPCNMIHWCQKICIRCAATRACLDVSRKLGAIDCGLMSRLQAIQCSRSVRLVPGLPCLCISPPGCFSIVLAAGNRAGVLSRARTPLGTLPSARDRTSRLLHRCDSVAVHRIPRCRYLQTRFAERSGDSPHL